MKLFDGHIHAGVHTKTSEIISFLDRIGGDYGLVLAADHGKWDLDNPQAYCSDEAVIRLVNEGGGRLYGLFVTSDKRSLPYVYDSTSRKVRSTITFSFRWERTRVSSIHGYPACIITIFRWGKSTAMSSM